MNAKTRELINAHISMLEQISGDIEELAGGEQEKYDNLSGGLQQSEKDQSLEAAASALDSAKSTVDEAISYLEDSSQ